MLFYVFNLKNLPEKLSRTAVKIRVEIICFGFNFWEDMPIKCFFLVGFLFSTRKHIQFVCTDKFRK